MKYYFNTFFAGTFEEAITRTTEELKKEGFGILTQIDVKATMKKKLDVKFSDYMILGACEPSFALKALLSENKIGTMLPCNVIVRADASQRIEIAAVDPAASMQAVDNKMLEEVAGEIREKLQRVIAAL